MLVLRLAIAALWATSFFTNGILNDAKIVTLMISVIEVNKSFTEITIEAKRVNKPCEKWFKDRVTMKPTYKIYCRNINFAK